MIALDTNVLVRFLVEDDAKQTRRAAALLQQGIEDDETFFIPDVTLVETVWVLIRRYKLDRAEVVSVLRRLLAARHLRFSSTDRLNDALDAFDSGRGDFSDYVIRAQAFEAGCSSIATFDRALLREPGFTAP